MRELRPYIFKIFFLTLLTSGGTFLFYSFSYSDKILPHVFISAVDVGGMSAEEAALRVRENMQTFYTQGIQIMVAGPPAIASRASEALRAGREEVIDPENIDLTIPVEFLAQKARSVGRGGAWHERIFTQLGAPFSTRIVSAEIQYNQKKLANEIALIAKEVEVPRKDIRYGIKGVTVNILYDTKPGALLNQERAKNLIIAHLASLDTRPVYLIQEEDLPVVDPETVPLAKEKAERLMAQPLTLSYKDKKFVVTREKIGSWIISLYDEKELAPGLNEQLISEYVVKIAEQIDTLPVNPTIRVEDVKVVEFAPPKVGRALSQNDTIALIKSALQKRISGSEIVKELSLPVLVKKPVGEGSAAEFGIRELIGKATTPFTGSPKNRISNIKNGTKFLTGLLVAPGEEFSTIGALGNIDNTTGYLPELVIKGDETIPEFGGGLCQVSTTLFRAVMNAGLPVLERRNHSYRVPYYEKDGEGNVIGPGLDATIYSGWPDFKFKNDTEAHILIQGSVNEEENKITFELYGTKDDRKSFIDGPHILKETPPPDTVYIETNNLPKGEKKKIDTAHPGGAAVATYKIEYPDGRVEEQEFKSYYRPWPEKWLVGTATSTLVR